MRRLFALLVGFTAIVAFGTSAQAAHEPQCGPRTATATKIEAVQADYASWRGKCVKLSGIVFDGRLYADRMAFAEPPLDVWKGHPRAIVIKPRKGPSRDRTPRLTEVVGRIGSCADENAAVEAMQSQTSDIIFLAGYCHTSLENYVVPSVVRAIGKNVVPRLQAPAGLKGLPEAQVEAKRMLRILLDHDEDGYARSSQPELAEDLDKTKGARKPDWLSERLHDIHIDYARIEGRIQPDVNRLAPDAAMMTFVERSELSSDDSFPSLLHCWCKGPDCAGRWPVLLADADNLRQRPFLCITTNGYLLGPERKTVIQSRVPFAEAGFAEPRAD
jgi:hypothetical protein